jgi:hypothetical protein
VADAKAGWCFETDRFTDVEQTEGEVNPGRYGEGLATWLAAELGARGWQVTDTFAEDWGWCIAIRDGARTLYVVCGNEDGSVTKWFAAPIRPGLIRRLAGRAASGRDAQAPRPRLARDRRERSADALGLARAALTRPRALEAVQEGVRLVERHVQSRPAARRRTGFGRAKPVEGFTRRNLVGA